MGSYGAARRLPPLPTAVRKGGSDLAFTLADEAVADDAIADAAISGKPQLAPGAASVRRSASGAARNRSSHTGTTDTHHLPPGAARRRD